MLCDMLPRLRASTVALMIHIVIVVTLPIFASADEANRGARYRIDSDNTEVIWFATHAIHDLA